MSTVVAALLALLAAAAPEAGQWTIHSGRGPDAVSRHVADLLPRAQSELESLLGLELRGPAAVVLCGSTDQFRRATPGVDHRHTLGVAYPARKVVYLNCEEIERRRFESLDITLRHELSHLIVGEVVRRGHRRVPLWFDEGVAVWNSGKIPCYDQRDFQRAVAAGRLAPLARLADRFPLDVVARGVAYEQSESFVRYLVREHGERVVRDILQAAARGTDFEAAVREATGADLAVLEERWLRAIRPWWPWASWIVNTFSLFSTMSVLALVAFYIYWRRRRRRYQEWEMEESFRGQEDSPWR